MLWSGEEQGLLGSAAYVKAHKELMPKISAVLVHDGGTNYLSGIGATEAILSDFEQVFAPVKELDPKYPFEVRKVAGLSGGGSDHASFLAANVPGFFWRQSGKARYQHTHHTQFDTFDAAIPEYQQHSSLVVGARRLRDRQPRPSAFSRQTPRAGRDGQPPDARRAARRDDGRRGGGRQRRPEGRHQEGDEILKIDGTKVADRADLTRLLRAGGPHEGRDRRARRQGNRSEPELGDTGRAAQE